MKYNHISNHKYLFYHLKIDLNRKQNFFNKNKPFLEHKFVFLVAFLHFIYYNSLKLKLYYYKNTI